MTEEQRISKNENIRLSMLATKAKRANQICRVYTVKIDKSRLSKQQLESIKMLFVESKWIWNNCVSYFNENNTIKGYSDPKKVIVKKDGVLEERKLKYIGSQMKQSIIKQFSSNIKSCFSNLKSGHIKHFKLKYKKSDVTSIDLKQYSTTYKFHSRNKVKIQNIPGKVVVNGANQFIDIEGIEYANAKLLNTPLGYYLSIVTYIDKNRISEKPKTNQTIGIDFGCITSFTLSNGEKITSSVQETDRLKRWQRKMHRRQKGSKRRLKARMIVQKEYAKMINKKNDLANKTVAYLSSYNKVIFQDEQLQSWKIKHGKKVHHSILGRVKAKLKSKPNCIMIDKFYPTSKLCTKCGHYHDNLSLNDRIFICPTCGYEEDRDIHAANNMIWIYENIVGVGRTEVKRCELEALLHSMFDINGATSKR